MSLESVTSVALLEPNAGLVIRDSGGRKLLWFQAFTKSLRNCISTSSVILIRFANEKFQFWNDGPRNVLRPRLPPPGIELASSPFGPRGATTIPVPLIGVVKGRRS